MFFKKLKPWFLSLRPEGGVYCALLVALVFELQPTQLISTTELLVLCLTTFFGVSTCLAWNDWYDRDIDLKKSPPKDFAYTQGKKYFLYVCALLGITTTLSVVVFSWYPVMGIILFSHILIILLYGPSQRFFSLSTFIVAMTDASLMFFPLSLPEADPRTCLLLASILFLIFFTREMIMDLGDMSSDVGVKNTLPLKIGRKQSSRLMGCLLCLSFGLAVVFERSTLLSAPFMLLAIKEIFSDIGKHTKLKLDIYMTSLLVIVWLTH